MNWDQARLWDSDTAAHYDPVDNLSQVGPFAPEVIAATVAALAELADGGPVLEFAIGTGRIGVPLAESGVSVTGLELSPPMVERLRTKIDETALPVQIGDMATDRVDGEFSLVVLVFNTISNLLSQTEQVDCFANAGRHLRPGGRFVVELGVPELRALTPGKDAVVFSHEPGYLGVDSYDVVSQVQISHHVWYDDDDRQGRVTRSPHRYIWPAEMDLMGRLAGFELEARWSDWDRSAFTAESTSHVSVYRLV